MILTLPIIGQFRITRVRKRKPHPLDCQAYHRDYEEKRQRVIEELKKERGEEKDFPFIGSEDYKVEIKKPASYSARKIGE